jgi:carbon-monoxide dehydrogenase large subunit
MGDDGLLTVWDSTQMPHRAKMILVEALGIGEERLRVIAPDVGGGFGYKCVLQPEEICVAWLALTFKRPFRYVEDRREHLIAGANSRQHHYQLKAYADDRGRLLALDAEITIDGGAYSNWPFTVALEPGQATGNLPGPYDIKGYRCKTYCVATNKPGFLPYRGVARTSVCFAIELLIDAIARKVGREPWEVRYENLVTPQAMPYTNIARKRYDTGDYPQSLDTVRREIDLDKWRTRQSRGEPDGRRIGIGFASYCEQSAHGTSVFAAWGLPLVPGFDQATARLLVDGSLEIRAGVHSHGQGMETTLAQIAHEVIGIDISRIRVILGDTGATPFSTGTYASRSIVMTGGAVAKSCETLLPRLLAIGAHLMQCATNTVHYMPGRVVGPQASVSVKEIAEAWYRRPQLLPPDVDVNGLEATIGYKPEVDTGVFAEDCGKMVNPMVVDGQTMGGAAQGIGTALFEESPYDANGQPLASTFMDYLLPGATEVPKFRLYHTETLSPHTKFGIKGMGEGGAIAPPAALFNAINDALRGINVELSETPLTPRRLLTAIEQAETKGTSLVVGASG